MSRVTREFISSQAGSDVLGLVAAFCLVTLALLAVAGIVEGLRALHGWLMSYIGSDIESGS